MKLLCCRSSSTSHTATAVIRTPVAQRHYYNICSLKVKDKRLNGWQCPWDAMQVFSWLTIPLVGGLTLCVAVPLPAFPIFPVLVLLAFAWNVVCMLMLTSIDPAPDGRHIQPVKFERNEEHQHVIEKGYCYVCRNKALKGTKHCRHCNKCIPGYDHHCKWMFIVLVSSLTVISLLFCLIFFAAVFFFVVRKARGHTELFLAEWTFLDPVFWCILCVIAIFCHIIVFGFTAHLLNFHFMLWRNGLTTISYIQQKRQKEKTLSNGEQQNIATITGNMDA